MMLAIFLLISMVSIVNASIVVEHKEVMAEKGGYIELICNTSAKAVGCTFKSPESKEYEMYASHDYNRITPKKGNICAMMLSPVKPSDNGVWSCNVDSIENNSYVEDSVEIKLPYNVKI